MPRRPGIGRPRVRLARPQFSRLPARNEANGVPDKMTAIVPGPCPSGLSRETKPTLLHDRRPNEANGGLGRSCRRILSRSPGAKRSQSQRGSRETPAARRTSSAKRSQGRAGNPESTMSAAGPAHEMRADRPSELRSLSLTKRTQMGAWAVYPGDSASKPRRGTKPISRWRVCHALNGGKCDDKTKPMARGGVCVGLVGRVNGRPRACVWAPDPLARNEANGARGSLRRPCRSRGRKALLALSGAQNPGGLRGARFRAGGRCR